MEYNKQNDAHSGLVIEWFRASACGVKSFGPPDVEMKLVTGVLIEFAVMR